MAQRVPTQDVKGMAMLTLLVAIGGLIVLKGGNRNAPAAQAGKTTGYPQLVSVQPWPETDGEMCQWVPASAGSSLMAAIEQQREARQSSPSEESKAEVAKRKPVRMIHDSYAAFSAVAIDPAHNEVVMTDENLFSIVAYDRLENTPPKAKMSEPKRIIQGMNTDIEFQCALYVDPPMETFTPSTTTR